MQMGQWSFQSSRPLSGEPVCFFHPSDGKRASIAREGKFVCTDCVDKLRGPMRPVRSPEEVSAE